MKIVIFNYEIDLSVKIKVKRAQLPKKRVNKFTYKRMEKVGGLEESAFLVENDENGLIIIYMCS